MRVLVSGGAGYIGSHATRELLDHGHEVVVLDNLVTGHRWAVDPRADFAEGDVGDPVFLRNVFTRFNFDAVLHFAAFIEVAESVKNPEKYYQNNFSNVLVLLETLRQHSVQKFIFSSTAAVYGEPTRNPIQETDPVQPINPYGRSKMMAEKALEDFSKIHKLSFTALRYFNVAGAHPSSEIGEAHEPETHLIPRVLVSLRAGQPVKLFGTDYPTPDGTCVRDYVHVVDVARAHVLALESQIPSQNRVFNLGSEKGFSVLEIIRACEKVTGKKIEISEEGRRSGDPAVLIASSQKIRRELIWKPIYPDIETIVRHAWNWHCKKN